MAFEDAARLAVLVSEQTLRYFDKFDAIMEQRFKAMERERKHWRTLGWAQAKGHIEKR
jgi:hypothetical protein